MESWTSSGSMPGGMNSWDSKEEEGRGLVVGVLEALLEWERGWRKEKKEGGDGVLVMEREEEKRDREGEGVWNWRVSFITPLLTSAVIVPTS